MKCRSCGQTNQLENKFCGFCGKPVHEERRSAERRFIAWEPHQCRSCGHKNSAGNKFCGMCGTALQADRRVSERRAAQAKSPSGARAIPVKTPSATPADHPDDSNHAATSYLGAPSPSSNKPRSEWIRSSGSSFLGLEDEGPADSEYLLTDEEPPGGGGWRALIALLILAAVGYLVFKNWDSPTIAAAIAQIQKHTQTASTPEPKAQQPSTEQPSISTDENAASADAEKQSGQASQTPKQDTTKDQPKQDAQKSNPLDKPPQDADAGDANSSDVSSNTGPEQKSAQGVPEEDRNDKTDSANETKSEKSTSSSNKPPDSAPAQELYERGQAYLSGHGAPQSCDQGVVYTRAAAQQGNPKAAVQMGALYATGRCVSQDRVQAYNWFNEALRNDPSNEYVERSRSTLWAQMTSEERQRAAKGQY